MTAHNHVTKCKHCGRTPQECNIASSGYTPYWVCPRCRSKMNKCSVLKEVKHNVEEDTPFARMVVARLEWVVKSALKFKMPNTFRLYGDEEKHYKSHNCEARR